MTTGEEIWLPIKGFENLYDVSNQGRVRGYMWSGGARLKEARIKKPVLNKKTGYLCVNLYKEKKPYPFILSRLIISTFECNMPSEIHCRHLDGNKLNCKLNNLKWGTRKENEADKIIHGTLPNGERNGLSKLKNSSVLEIRKAEGSTYHIASIFGISQQNVSAIKSRKTWRHI